MYITVGKCISFHIHAFMHVLSLQYHCQLGVDKHSWKAIEPNRRKFCLFFENITTAVSSHPLKRRPL